MGLRGRPHLHLEDAKDVLDGSCGLSLSLSLSLSLCLPQSIQASILSAGGEVAMPDVSMRFE
jgi:hypothetical protein